MAFFLQRKCVNRPRASERRLMEKTEEESVRSRRVPMGRIRKGCLYPPFEREILGEEDTAYLPIGGRQIAFASTPEFFQSDRRGGLLRPPLAQLPRSDAAHSPPTLIS